MEYQKQPWFLLTLALLVLQLSCQQQYVNEKESDEAGAWCTLKNDKGIPYSPLTITQESQPI